MSLLSNSLQDVRSNLPRNSIASGNSSRQSKTILLAEDDHDLRYVMECTFKAMGYQVVACADAQIASCAFRSRSTIDMLLTRR